MRIVSPYRPFAPESAAHLRLGQFDWIAALRMLAVSARERSQCEVVALTDVDTDLPVPAFRYATAHRRLMLWILEVSLRYLDSDDFDQDTVMVSPDVLVMGDLRPYFVADLGVVIRLGEKYTRPERQLLNSAQWWRVAAKDRLIDFYRRALAIAVDLPPSLIAWGADTVPLVELIAPLQYGRSDRAGLTVCAMDHREILPSFNATMLRHTLAGKVRPRNCPLLDFKYDRKAHLRTFFETAFRQVVPV